MVPSDPLRPIPLAILTGFLGAGKTTRLNRWLADSALADTLVIINEFGETGLDHLLVEEAPGDMILMAAGCLCCTIRGDLVATLEDLLRRRDNNRIRFFRQVIIETTGLADPLPILQSVLQHPYLSKRFAISGLLTLVDAVNGAATLAAHPEARRQVALADRLLITKADLADAASLDALGATIAALNPAASPILDESLFAPPSLFAGAFAPESLDEGEIAAWLGATSPHVAGHAPNRHGETIESFTFIADAPIPEARLIAFREALRILHGPRLLRVKGLIALAETPEQPALIHHVQSVAHPLTRLARWPSRDRRSRLVFITDGLPRAVIEPYWQALIRG
ncbi:MAG: GTP-binding protein [Proteobacteria bacterium]|nr:GTP-binding protein [Pseudomonadota bacterium]